MDTVAFQDSIEIKPYKYQNNNGKKQERGEGEERECKWKMEVITDKIFQFLSGIKKQKEKQMRTS